MNLRQTYPALLLTLVVALPSWAQTMKPGLWEVNTKMKSADGQMEKAMAEMQAALADMPPEQRKSMEDMMAKQGIRMGPSSGGGMVTKICMSKELAARSALPVSSSGNCTEKRSPVVGGKMKASFSCTNPPSSGEADFTFSGDTGYTMRMNSTSQVGGKPEKMTMESSGRWMGADCGDIKPFTVPKAN